MELKEWQDKYDNLLNERIEQYTLEHENEIAVPNPLQSKEQQVKAFKLKAQEAFHPKEADEQMRHALELICNQLPQNLPKETWDRINEQFSSSEENLLNYLEDNQEVADDGFVSIYEMCGFTISTLVHCYEFGQSLYNKKSYKDAKSIMTLLMRISPLMPEFWIAAGMCEKQMGNHLAAVQLYKLAQTAFPDEPSMHIYCADNQLSLGNKLEAQIELEAARKIFDVNPQSQAQWRSTYDFLLDKAK